MLKSNGFIFIFILFVQSAFAQEQAWKLDEGLESYPYNYKIGLELEVTERPLLAIINSVFDWESLEKFRRDSQNVVLEFTKKEKGDLTLDYLNNQEALNQIIKDNPELAARLTEGLDLAKAELIKEEPPKIISQETNKPELSQTGLLGVNGEPVSNQPKALIIPGQENKTPTLSSTGQIQGLNNGLIIPDNIDLSASQATASDGRDWKLLSNRWNALDEEIREENLRLNLMSARSKTRWMLVNLFSIRSEAKLIEKSSFEEMFIASNWPLKEIMEIVKDLRAMEFRNKEPENDANVVLSQLEFLAKSIAQFVHYNDPLGSLTPDSGYHIHLSVDKEERPESLRPLLEAWNHLVAIKLMRSGINPFEGRAFMRTHSYLEDKGSVRLMDSHHIELRDHFTDPATEVSMFLWMMSVSNQDALAHLYNEWMPEITEKDLEFVLINESVIFEQLVTSPFLSFDFNQSKIDAALLNHTKQLVAKKEKNYSLDEWYDPDL